MRRILIALMVLLGAMTTRSAYAAITKIQDGASMVVTSGGNTVSVTLPSTVTTNNMLGVCFHTGSASITGIADNQGNVYTQIAGLQTNGTAMWIVPAARAGSTTVTVTVGSGGVFAGMVVSEISGMNITPTIDGAVATTVYTAGQTTIKTGTVSTSGANPELILGCGFTDSIQTPSGLIDYGGGGGSPTAFSNQAQTSSGGGETLVGALQSVAATGPYGFQWNVTSSPTAGIVAAIKPGVSPTITCQAIGPNGFGGVCTYCPTTLATLGFYPVPSMGTCSTIVTNVATCAAGSVPSGSGTLQCPVCSNGTAWVGC